jgi:hypothetical protein
MLNIVLYRVLYIPTLFLEPQYLDFFLKNSFDKTEVSLQYVDLILANFIYVL